MVILVISQPKFLLMKIKLVIFLFATLAFVSCNERKVYSEMNKNFPENRWQKSDAKEFEFTIDQEARNYNVDVHFAYLSDFQVNPVPLSITIIHPDLSEEKREVNIVVKDKDGKETGDCGGDYCDNREVIFENKALAKGVYKVKIQHVFNGAYLPNVNGVGIEVIAQMD